MATEQELKNALLQAHQSGDSDAADFFATKIKGMRTEAPVIPASEPTQIQSEGDRLLGDLSGKAPALEQSYIKALQTGDIGKAEFLKGRIDERVKEGTSLDESLVSKVGEFGREIKFRAERAFGKVKDVVTGESQQTDLTRELEEFDVGKHGTGMGFGAQLVNLTSSGPEERAKMLRSAGGVIFPDEKGNDILITPNGEMFSVNKPGLSRVDVDSALQKAVMFGAGSRIAGGGVMSQVGGAMGTQAALEGGSLAAGGDFEIDEIGLSGLFEGAGLGVGKIIAKVISAMPKSTLRNIKDIDDLRPFMEKDEFKELQKLKKAEKVLGAPEVTGIQFSAKTSKAESRKEIQDLVQAASNVRDAERFATQTAKQDVFASKEIRKQIESIPSEGKDALDFGLKRVRDASDSVIKRLDGARSSTANKLFGNAFKNNADVNVSVIRDKIKASTDSISKGDLELVENKVLAFMKNKEGIDLSSMDGRTAQQLGWEIDNLIRGRGETSVGGNAKRFLIDLKKDLVNQIEKTNPGFKAANKRYAEQTRDIDEIEDGLIGLINKKSDVNQSTIQNLFNEKNLSAVKRLKGVLDKSDPTAFPALYKGWLTSRMNSLPNLEDVGNASEVIYREFFGNPTKISRIMELAPNPDFKRNLMFFKDYLSFAKGLRLSGGTKVGSDIVGTTTQGIAKASINPTAAGSRGIGGIWSKKKAKWMMNAIMDPKWAEQMKFLRTAKKIEIPQKIEEFARAAQSTAQGSRSGN